MLFQYCHFKGTVRCDTIWSTQHLQAFWSAFFSNSPTALHLKVYFAFYCLDWPLTSPSTSCTFQGLSIFTGSMYTALYSCTSNIYYVCAMQYWVLDEVINHLVLPIMLGISTLYVYDDDHYSSDRDEDMADAVDSRQPHMANHAYLLIRSLQEAIYGHVWSGIVLRRGTQQTITEGGVERTRQICEQTVQWSCSQWHREWILWD